ncbi:MAG: DUF1109 domain-containing protein [Betaproteobacteria bacterium]|nr:DUF1109 domain-containing protein [Betaproteobacteria bacterium]
MNTQDLIGLLAHDPMPAAPPARQQLAKPLLGAALACGLLVLLFWGVNPALRQMLAHPAFVIKMLWLALVIGFSGYGLLRLSRPGVSAGPTFWGLGLSMLAMSSLGLLQSAQTEPDSRLALWLGHSWLSCALSIPALSAPLLGALFWALRQLAPTRPRLTGAAAGALAGGVAASLYSLHCTETAVAFFAVWYGGGLLLASAAGALLGARWLRW